MSAFTSGTELLNGLYFRGGGVPRIPGLWDDVRLALKSVLVPLEAAGDTDGASLFRVQSCVAGGDVGRLLQDWCQKSHAEKSSVCRRLRRFHGVCSVVNVPCQLRWTIFLTIAA
jgi:hypothetical protein